MIVKAEFTAGQTIEKAINEALDFAERNHVGVRAEMNDVDMVFFALPQFTRAELVEQYKKQFEMKLRWKEQQP